MGMAVSTATMTAYGPMPTHRVHSGAWSLSLGMAKRLTMTKVFMVIRLLVKAKNGQQPYHGPYQTV